MYFKRGDEAPVKVPFLLVVTICVCLGLVILMGIFPNIALSVI